MTKWRPSQELCATFSLAIRFAAVEHTAYPVNTAGLPCFVTVCGSRRAVQYFAKARRLLWRAPSGLADLAQER
jgi:hypothetical protein